SFHGRHAVTQGLQTGSLAVGNSVVHLHEGDFRQDSNFGETTRKIETDDRPSTAKVAPLGAAQWAVAARQLGSGRDAVAGAEPTGARSGFENPGTEFVAEKLNGGFGFQPAFDPVKGQCRNAPGKLRFRD